MGERARGEEIGVTRMQVRVPRIHIGDNLAQIKAMRLANVQTFGSNVWRPNINLSAPQIDFRLRFLSAPHAAQIEKWSFFMCSCVISQRNHDFRTDTQIKKN